MNVGDAVEQALCVRRCSSNVAEKKCQAGDMVKCAAKIGVRCVQMRSIGNEWAALRFASHSILHFLLVEDFSLLEVTVESDLESVQKMANYFV